MTGLICREHIKDNLRIVYTVEMSIHTPNCNSVRVLYKPFLLASNSLCVPCSIIVPFSRTMILSAFRIVARRCAITTEVRPVSYTHLRAHETPEHLVCRL